MTDLVPVELTVLRRCALGDSAQETADWMTRSENTVKIQRRGVIRKLGARNITNAVHLAHVEGLLDVLDERAAPPAEVTPPFNHGVVGALVRAGEVEAARWVTRQYLLGRAA